MSPFKSAGASVQSTTGSRGVHISVSNAVYTMFRGSVKSTGYPLHSPVSPSLPPPPRASPCAITFQLESNINIGDEWSNFSPGSFYLRGERFRYLLIRRLVGPQKWFDALRNRKNLLPLRGVEFGLQFVACTVLNQLLCSLIISKPAVCFLLWKGCKSGCSRNFTKWTVNAVQKSRCINRNDV
jgi:hypothetical protein